MTTLRRMIELTIRKADLAELTSIARSRTEPAGRVERARILLAYRKDPSFYAVGQTLGLHAQTVQRCIERAKAEGALAALDERPRPGKEPTITVEAKTWVVALACRKAKELGYPHEVWTTRLLARHAREHGPAQGHACLSGLVQGTVCKILDAQEVKPHKVRYYLERRDPEFKAKMAQVLCVYRKVNILKKAAAAATKKNKKPSEAVTVISYDEKPGIQAIATTAPDLPPEPGVHPTFTREFEYKRHGTVSLLAGIDLITGKVHALVKDRHRSREFIDFLKLVDASYPTHTAIRLRQSFRPHLQGDESMARHPTDGPLRVHLHAQARFLAEPGRRLLLQARTLRPAAHPRRIQTGTQGSHHGCHGSLQSKSCRLHLVLQARKSRLIGFETWKRTTSAPIPKFVSPCCTL
jgi:transposase